MDDKYHVTYPDISHSASSTDLTGLMYRPPIDMDEYEAYQDVYGMEIPPVEDLQEGTN